MVETTELHRRALLDFLNKEDTEVFRKEYLNLLPYDQAIFFKEQTEDIRLRIYSYLSPREIASIIQNIDIEEIELYIIEMDPRFAATVFSEMPYDDVVDILQVLDKDEIASFFALMNTEDVKEIKSLMHYEDKTAGSIMTTEYVSVYRNQTVEETFKQMKTEAPEAETIYYTYVLDESKRLVGVLSLRSLVIAEPTDLVNDIMSDNAISVSAGRDQEDVAQMIRDYDFLALPVVDFQNHLLGIITVDDIIDVMDAEAHEDYSKLAAISEIDSPDSVPIKSAKKRLPWLIILMFLGMITASLIGSFEETLEKVPIVAIFIPLIAGMAGNAGTQSLAVAVRGIATGEYGKGSKLILIFKEALTGIIIGITIAILITLLITVWKGNFYLGLLVGSSILVTLIVATLSGALIPLFMNKLNIDPAVASGPFITTLNDITSVLIYFGLATTFMSLLL